MVRTFITLALCFTLLSGLAMISSPTHAATITAAVDRTVVQENESLTLTLSSDSGVDDDPDLSELEKDFRILSRGQSSNISIINGRVNRQIKWELMLMPKRVGNLQIPRIAFGKDRSNAIAIKVTPASAGGGSISDELVYMEAIVDDDTAYVQSQLIYTLRIYHAVQLRNASLTELEVSDKDAVIEKLAENRSYEKMINGRRYRVFEKQFAIFPQTVGEMVIEPAVLEAQYIDLPRVLRTKRLVSKPIKIEVQSVPQQAQQSQSGYWLPAHKLTLTEKWSSNLKEIKIGDPITRTLSLTADRLMSAQLPVLADSDSQAGVKQYADQPVLDDTIGSHGYMGKREEKIAYIPTQAGDLKLPPIKLTWWNRDKDQLETATLPGRTIKVIAAAGQATQGIAQSPPVITDKPGQEATSNTNPPLTIDAGIGGLSSQVWFAISVGLFVLWLLTMVTWYMTARRRKPQRKVVANNEMDNPSLNAILKQVKSACDANDPQQVKSALLVWGRQQWQQHPPTSLGHIAQRVNGALAAELHQLNDLLYKPGGAPWNSNGLWQALKKYIDKNARQYKKSQPAMQPLYRIALVNDDQ
ncbi:BatD family protein [Kaarinaea lacus]